MAKDDNKPTFRGDHEPTILYRCPGAHKCPQKGLPDLTFDTLSTASDEDQAASLKDGWFKTMPEAIKAYKDATAKK